MATGVENSGSRIKFMHENDNFGRYVANPNLFGQSESKYMGFVRVRSAKPNFHGLFGHAV